MTDREEPVMTHAIEGLQKGRIGTWISGDNEVTAKAVARTVGIVESHVIAGVLPHEKVNGQPITCRHCSLIQSTGAEDRRAANEWAEEMPVNWVEIIGAAAVME